jgi:hypothetical protein
MSESEVPKCTCNIDAVKRTVVKEGPNKGREFWTCNNFDQTKKCKFFQWADQAPETKPAAHWKRKRDEETDESESAKEAPKSKKRGTLMGEIGDVVQGAGGVAAAAADLINTTMSVKDAALRNLPVLEDKISALTEQLTLEIEEMKDLKPYFKEFRDFMKERVLHEIRDHFKKLSCMRRSDSIQSEMPEATTPRKLSDSKKSASEQVAKQEKPSKAPKQEDPIEEAD